MRPLRIARDWQPLLRPTRHREGFFFNPDAVRPTARPAPRTHGARAAGAACGALTRAAAHPSVTCAAPCSPGAVHPRLRILSPFSKPLGFSRAERVARTGAERADSAGGVGPRALHGCGGPPYALQPRPPPAAGAPCPSAGRPCFGTLPISARLYCRSPRVFRARVIRRASGSAGMPV